MKFVVFVVLLVMCVVGFVAVMAWACTKTSDSGQETQQEQGEILSIEETNQENQILEQGEVNVHEPVPFFLSAFAPIQQNQQNLFQGLRTRKGQSIYLDPSAEVHRKGETSRPLRPLRFKSQSEVQEELTKRFYNKRQHPYQRTEWSVSYFSQRLIGSHAMVRHSITMPVFNQQNFILHVLKSAFHCMTDLFEIIVICDGCTDNSERVVQQFFKEVEREEGENKCVQMILVHVQESILEAACLNIGFALSSGVNFLDIQADMVLQDVGFDARMEEPLAAYSDLLVVGGRCTENKEDSIGRANWAESAGMVPDLKRTKNVCFLMGNVNRGPLMFDADLFRKYFQCETDESRFGLGPDEHDLIYRAWTQHGLRAVYTFVDFDSPLEQGSTRQPRSTEQQWIVSFRNRNRPSSISYVQMYLPSFRPLSFSARNSEAKRGDMYYICFGNSQSVWYNNAELAHQVHTYLGLPFQTRLYTEFDLRDFFAMLPPDAQHTRGYNYWSWKPAILLDTMDKVPEGAIIVYADSGLFIKDKELFMEQVSQLSEEKWGLFYNIEHEVLPWCKEEVRVAFEPPLTDDSEPFVMSDASFMLFVNGEKAREFVKQWKKMILTPYWISDEVPPERKGAAKNPSFIESRHDQTLLTACLRNNKIPYEQTKHNFICHHKARTNRTFASFVKSLNQ